MLLLSGVDLSSTRRRRLRVPEILTTPLPEILATPT
jgi:hypothetical protein